MDVSKYARRFYSDSLPSGNAKLGDFSIFNNDLYFFNGSQWLLVANSGNSLPVGGDLSGTTANAEVIGIAGIPVSPTPPLVGEALVFDGLEYIPTPIIDPSYSPYLVFVSSITDLPAPVANVITLQSGYSDYFVTEIDLLGSRIVCGTNTAIIGTSSENAKILSTGLVGVALISSSNSLPMRNISIEADIAFELDATGNPGQALDWFSVNLINCNQIGIITNYNNFNLQNSAIINSGNLILDGAINTIRAENVLCQGVFALNPGQYVEMFIANNTSGGGTVTVTEMNFIIERLV